MSKGYRSHFGGASTGQIWDNFNIKIIIYYNSLDKIGNHESVLIEINKIM